MTSTGRRVVRRSLVTAVAGLVVTLVVGLLPSVPLAYRSPDGHLVLETVVATVSPLVALLLYGRFRRSRLLRELLLAHALAVLAVASLVVAVASVVTDAGPGSALTSWAPLVVRLASAVLLLVAALVPPDRVVAAARPARQVLAVAVVLLAVGATAQALGAALPTAVEALPSPERSGRPVLAGHPVLLGAQSTALACFAAAAVALTRQARRTGDDFLGWVAAAAVLGAWSRVNYLLFPSLYSQWLYTGDVLRLGFYLLLLTGGLLEVRSYWRAQARVAVAAERRRLARDLHDGAVQELGYILSVTSGPEDRTSPAVRSAAQRALAETRRAVVALSSADDEPLEAAVAREVREVGERHGMTVHVRSEAQHAPLSLEHREQVVRIAREAAWNARHGRATELRVLVRPGELVVEDDGAGFDPAAVPPGRYGLVSMGDRAEGMGAVLALESAPGRGTRVAVAW
ncbi:hypothetical protein [uncultured Pseudokineococcus sp.]|uniref:sensor histidine kinase n=1 Tax=uncultured Pseudokineococcus sp. TaxID=1642928 RepID=UPI00260B21BB|nr:hypothetical protein [uncultured Pseudokineococcus sp.]